MLSATFSMKLAKMVEYSRTLVLSAVHFYQRARSAYADLWLNYGFNFPGGCRQIPDKLLVTQPTEAAKTRINWNMIKLM